MPRAHPFTRAGLGQRRELLGLKPDTADPGEPIHAFALGCRPDDEPVVAKLVKDAGIATPLQPEFAYKLKTAIVAYRVRLLAHQQERPAALVAALKPVLKAATSLLRRCTPEGRERLLRHLLELPDGLRFDLRAGGLEQLLRTRITNCRCFRRLTVSLRALIERGEAKRHSLQAKIKGGAPTGSAAIGAAFREQLLMIFSEYQPDAPDAKWRQWTGDVWATVGDADLDPKKHAKRFRGGFTARK